MMSSEPGPAMGAGRPAEGGVYTAMKRHEVRLLRDAGLTQARVSETAEVSERTVRRIEGEEPTAPTAEALAKVRGVGRPSKAEAFRGFVAEILQEEPALPTVEVLHRARERGFQGGKSGLYALVAEMRCPSEAPMVRFEGLPGEFSQHDFGHVDVKYLSGGKERLHFFASKLKYSRWCHVVLVPNEKVESVVRPLLASFEAFGGVPLVGVFDNPKTIVLGRKGNEVEWNKTFGQVALDYRFAPELCTPRRANQKGSVENLVGFVKGNFFKVRRFQDRRDLEDQLAAWHKEVNEVRPSRATGEVPLQRIAAERRRLRPLAIPPSEYALRFPVVVGPTGVVEHAGIRYSMPPECIGFPATLYLYPEKVRIVARRYEATHPRRPAAGSRESWLPGHRSQMLARVSGTRGRLYFKREQILSLGAPAEAVLTEIVHRHPRTWTAEVEILFDLLERFGVPRMKAALERAVERRLFGAHFVRVLLQRGVA
jgi:transposase